MSTPVPGLDDESAAPEVEPITPAGQGEPGAPGGRGGPAGSGLARRAARGAAVTLLGQGGRIVLQLASVVVLARVLTPADYGLVAVVLLVVGVGDVVRDFGLSSATVQAATVSRAQQHTLWWLNTAIGAVLAIGLVLLAGPVAALFGQPAAAGVARALAPVFLLNGATTQFRADLVRSMRFRRLAAADVGAQAVALAVAVGLAVAGAGYRALVAQQLVQAGVLLVVLAASAGWLPRAPRRDTDVRAFLRYGAPLVATQLVNYASKNVDTLTVGLRFGAVSTGLYTRAFQLVNTPLAQLRAPATTVALPTLSRLRDDEDRSERFLLRAQVVLGYTLVALLALAAGAAVPATAVLLGPRWAGAAPLVALLAASGAFQLLAYVGYWVYLSRGLTAELLRYTLVSLVLQAVCVVAGSLLGLRGVAAGYLLATVLEWPLSFAWLSRRTRLPAAALYRAAGRILACAVLAGGLAFVVSTVSAGLPAAVTLLLAVAAGLAGYGVAAAVSRAVRVDLAAVVDTLARVARR